MLRTFLALSAIFSLFTSPLSASNLVAPVGVVGSATLAVVPSSTLVVTLDVVTEDVTVGPYARYAQKLLGMRAPLVAKTTTTISSAKIQLAAEDYFVASGCCGKKDIKNIVAPLSIDAMSGGVLTAETAAELAADEIFKIRRIRREMISGDLGEGYFGAGLEAALARLDQDEQAYLELFVGRTIVTTESRRFNIAIDADLTRYIVCRYSPQLGIVDSSDLSAEPILLQITPSGKKSIVSPATGDKSARVFRVADQSTCELFYGSKSLESNVIPLFEFGYDVSYLIK